MLVSSLSAKLPDSELKGIADSINSSLQEMGVSNTAIRCSVYNHSDSRILVFEYSGSLLTSQNAAMMANKLKADFTKDWTKAESRAFKKEGYNTILFKVREKTASFTL